MKGFKRRLRDNWEMVTNWKRLSLTLEGDTLRFRWFISKGKELLYDALLPLETVEIVKQKGYDWSIRFSKDVDGLPVTYYMRGRTKTEEGAKVYFIEVVRYAVSGEFVTVFRLGSHKGARRACNFARNVVVAHLLGRYLQSITREAA